MIIRFLCARRKIEGTFKRKFFVCLIEVSNSFYFFCLEWILLAEDVKPFFEGVSFGSMDDEPINFYPFTVQLNTLVPFRQIFHY